MKTRRTVVRTTKELMENATDEEDRLMQGNGASERDGGRLMSTMKDRLRAVM